MMLVKDELLLGNLGRVLVGDSETDPAVSEEMDVLRCRVLVSVMTRESWESCLEGHVQSDDLALSVGRRG
jgi:hypothetical protein